MKVTNLALSIMIVAAMQLPVFADEKNDQAQIVSLQASMADKNTFDVRGGGTSKMALGLYNGGHKIEFRSGYEKLPSKEQAEWANDLHQFVVSKGGGYDNLIKYAKEYQEKGRKKPVTGEYGPDVKPDPYDPDVRAAVSYADQKKFAEEWWTAKDRGYKSAVMKDWWLNDAILDGTNLCNQFEAKTEHSAERQAWRDSELTLLVKKN